jgi:hypothetical protein
MNSPTGNYFPNRKVSIAFQIGKYFQAAFLTPAERSHPFVFDPGREPVVAWRLTGEAAMRL